MTALDELQAKQIAATAGGPALVFRTAAAMILTQDMHGNRTEARPDAALLRAAAAWERDAADSILTLREVLGMSDAEFAVWRRRIDPAAGSYVLRAIAHALEWRDI